MKRDQTGAARLGVALAAMMMAAPVAMADPPQPGVWEGSADDGHRVVATRLSLAKLEIGDQKTAMKWFSPRDCSLFLEYAGKPAAAYEWRVFSSNGGWCDLYRGGALDLDGSAQSLKFSLTDQKGGRVLEGELNRPGT